MSERQRREERDREKEMIARVIPDILVRGCGKTQGPEQVQLRLETSRDRNTTTPDIIPRSVSFP